MIENFLFQLTVFFYLYFQKERLPFGKRSNTFATVKRTNDSTDEFLAYLFLKEKDKSCSEPMATPRYIL